MERLYRIFMKMGIFGWWQKFSDRPVDISMYKDGTVKCIEYIQVDTAKLKAKDIEEIEWLIEEAKQQSDSSSAAYRWVATEFNRTHFEINARKEETK